MIYICIPSYDEERTIGVLLWKLRQVMTEFPRDYQMLVVDDASTDATSEILDPYCRVLPLTVFRHTQRRGYAASLEELLREAVRRSVYPRRDVIVTLQADFTEEPEEVPALVKRIEAGADVVTSSGRLDAAHAPRAVQWARRLFGYLLPRIDWPGPVTDPISGFRAYRVFCVKKAIGALDGAPLLRSEGWAANLELLQAVRPFARRMDEATVLLRYDRRRRGTRFRAWTTGLQLARLKRQNGRVLALALAMLLAGSSGVLAQNGHVSAGVAVAAVPFGPGERLDYKLTLGIFGEVGKGSMEVVGVEDVRGSPAYHLRFDLKGGILFAKVDDRLQSWLDVSRLQSHRFRQDQKEFRYERHRTLDFFPHEMLWRRLDKDESGALATERPLDDVSFIYFVRTLPLEVGQTYTFHRYFKADGNPVVVKVLRKEVVKVPAGTFETIVVQPIIQTDGLFGKGGRAEIYFTDDEQRLVVQLKSHVPVIGSLNLYLDSYQPGAKLSPLFPPSPPAPPGTTALPGSPPPSAP
ncbi:MAG: DUF3108 domain-containing protein [Gemmatimonadetes bacterium]|nr:DUF3108 domain-containing protein [Gemmatimonadota bacterium]